MKSRQQIEDEKVWPLSRCMLEWDDLHRRQGLHPRERVLFRELERLQELVLHLEGQLNDPPL